MLRGGVALRRRRLPVDRLEYSHADVPVAQGVCWTELYNEAAVDCDPLPSSAVATSDIRLVRRLPALKLCFPSGLDRAGLCAER